MAKLSAIEGISTAYAAKLAKAGLETTEALLERGASPMGRNELAAETGISLKLILTWVNHADLFRIKGVGKEYADLLVAAGVDTVLVLAQRNPENLQKKLVEINQEKKLVRKTPTLTRVKNWVRQAKALPRIIGY